MVAPMSSARAATHCGDSTSHGTMGTPGGRRHRAIVVRLMRFMLVDAFARGRFTGNPAAVVLVDREFGNAERQALAMEFNQAETAFVEPRGDGTFALSWFTPTSEVELCGHATLAAAAAVRTWGVADGAAPIRFITRCHGELRCSSEGDAIAMDFPATPPAPCSTPRNVQAGLGLPRETPVTCVGTAAMNLCLRLPDEASLVRVEPRLGVIAGWHPVGVLVTAPAATAGVDFVSRFFAPAVGIPEDPVTGSAHCTLAVYWAAQLGRMRLHAMQLSRRRGWLEVRLAGARVTLVGAAQITAQGQVSAFG
jgi:PhzF family phenazine biosynthesis protein